MRLVPQESSRRSARRTKRRSRGRSRFPGASNKYLPTAEASAQAALTAPTQRQSALALFSIPHSERPRLQRLCPERRRRRTHWCLANSNLSLGLPPEKLRRANSHGPPPSNSQNKKKTRLQARHRGSALEVHFCCLLPVPKPAETLRFDWILQRLPQAASGPPESSTPKTHAPGALR